MNEEEARSESAFEEAREGPPPRNDDSIRANFERLVASGKDLAAAEIDWAKLKGKTLASFLKRGLAFTLIAVVCLMVGLSLLLVAGIVALAPIVGLLYATLIVIAFAFALSITCGLLARRAFRRMVDEAVR